MFEIGFSELCMVSLVALLVIGPEKLPQVARMAGFWLGKSRRTIAAIKQEIHQELQAEELRQALHHKTGLHEFQQLLEETSQELRTIDQPSKSALNPKAAPRDEQP